MGALPALIVSLLMLTLAVIFAFLHVSIRQETTPVEQAVEIQTEA
jgi:hypothetical protein